MSNMNSRTRSILYEFLRLRDGGICKKCSISENEKELVIDHIDNNNGNNSLDNVQLLCRKCNYIKNPRLAEREPLDSVGVCATPQLDMSMEIRINREKEPQFRKYVIDRISRDGEAIKTDLIDSGAEVVGISPKTSTKYLRKMCSSEGQFQIIRKNRTDYVIKRHNVYV